MRLSETKGLGEKIKSMLDQSGSGGEHDPWGIPLGSEARKLWGWVREAVALSVCTGLPSIRRSPGSDLEPPEAAGHGWGETW